MQNKQSLRKIAKSQLVSIENKNQKDKLIEHSLNDLLNNIKDKNILVYHPKADEPDLSKLFTAKLCNENSVYYSSFDDYSMIAVDGSWSDDFGKIDIVIIPGLGFTANGYRLGRGGGWYDRVILKLKNSSRKIGVCYDFQIIQNLPISDHDQKVDLIITDSQIINVKEEEK